MMIDAPLRASRRRALLTDVWLATRLSVALLLIAGIAYPALLWTIARVAFPNRAEGSLVHGMNGRVVGSALIGQAFVRTEYFHGRPSAAAYDAAASTGSNIGPSNPQLLAGNGGAYAGVTTYASAYRRENGLDAHAPIPSDAVMASGSGLDPDISPLNAELQVPRVAVARAPALSESLVRALVQAHTSGRSLGIFGEPRVNVLRLNLALDSAAGAVQGRP